MTAQARLLLEAFLENPGKEWHGLELMDATELKSGAIYPLLHRLQEDGWLNATWEGIDPERERRPARRLYRLAALGQREAIAAFERRTRSVAKVSALRPKGASI